MSCPLRFFAVLAALVALSPASPATAQPPVIEPGECLYLVGAPPGAPAAETAETTEHSRIYDVCTVPAQVDLNRDGPNMVQAWIELDPAAPLTISSCELLGAVGHVFATSAEGGQPAEALIRVHGSFDLFLAGTLSGDVFGAGATLKLQAGERSGSGDLILVEREIAAFGAHADETRDVADAFGVAMTMPIRSGREYFARLVVELDASIPLRSADIGSPGTGRFAAYDSMEVCVTHGSAAGVEAAHALEHALYRRECYPGLWLPEAHGGRLEEARDLVALRIQQAENSAERAANVPVARGSLARADGAIVDGEYQAACRWLVKGLHALTTP